MSSRRNRRNLKNRRNRRSRRSGGFIAVSPGEYPFTDGMGSSPSHQSLLQGTGFQNAHKLQHGGVAPLDYNSTLDAELRGAARLTSQDASYSAISNMSDQSGGRRRRKRSRRHCSRRHRSRRHRSRRLRGGSHLNMAPLNGDADLSSSYGVSPGMLLKDYAGAGLNSDFKDFKSILPK